MPGLFLSGSTLTERDSFVEKQCYQQDLNLSYECNTKLEKNGRSCFYTIYIEDGR